MGPSFRVEVLRFYSWITPKGCFRLWDSEILHLPRATFWEVLDDDSLKLYLAGDMTFLISVCSFSGFIPVITDTSALWGG